MPTIPAITARPDCSWGYYSYYPYACAPYGYYGPGWFYGGLFIGAGPWYTGASMVTPAATCAAASAIAADTDMAIAVGYGYGCTRIRGSGVARGYAGGAARGYAGGGVAHDIAAAAQRVAASVAEAASMVEAVVVVSTVVVAADAGNLGIVPSGRTTAHSMKSPLASASGLFPLQR